MKKAQQRHEAVHTAVLLCSSTGVNFCAPEPTQEGGDGQAPLIHSQALKESGVSPALPHISYTGLAKPSAPLFPPCLVQCGIILFSFPVSVKALMVDGTTVPPQWGVWGHWCICPPFLQQQINLCL